MAGEAIIGKGLNSNATYISFTPRLKQVFICAQKEAKQSGLLYIKKEHLLIALLNEEEGVAARILQNLGADARKMKEELTKLMNEQSINE